MAGAFGIAAGAGAVLALVFAVLWILERPTPEMRAAVWWELHSWLGLIATWLAAASILSASLRLLGVKAPRMLIPAAAVGGSTGPLLLAVCSALLKAGWT